MGDPNQFGSPFSTQPRTFPNNSQNPAVSENQAGAASGIFSNSSASSGFATLNNSNAAASGAMPQDPTHSQVPSNLFSNTGSKSIFGTSSVNNEASASVFGGMAFSKPSENVFSSSVRPSLFGGSASVTNSQSLNAQKTDGAGSGSVFGRVEVNSSVTAPKEVVSSASIFGGSSTAAQDSRLNPINSLSFPTMESASVAKPSIFGGAYLTREEPQAKSGFSLAANDGHSDKAKINSFAPEKTPVTFEGLASSASSEKPTLFSSPKSAFGRFSGAGIVTSTLPGHSKQRSSDQFTSNFNDEREEGEVYTEGASDHASGWEADSLEGVIKDNVSDKLNKSPQGNKLVRAKQGVFEKALQDATKSSSETTRSIQCLPLEGKLADYSVLKEHFQQFGATRVTVGKDGRYATVTYKTNGEAEKAMKGPPIIAGAKYKFFWRNMAKTKRKSVDEEDKPKTTVERRRIGRRSDMDLDDDVREELAAISGTDYLMPQDASSKRKATLNREVRKKSRPVVKSGDSEGREVPDEDYHPVKKNISLTSRTEGRQDLKSRTSKMPKESRTDEKSALHRLSYSDRNKKSKDDSADARQESTPVNPPINSAITSELMTALKQQAITSEDKLRLLDVRDKLIRHLQPKQYDISKAVKTVGTCPDMCPEKERLLRETRRQISQYEMSSSKTLEMDPNLMVKQYSRSSADQEEPLPHDLRPPAVLTMTMNYLMHTIMNQGDEPGENLGEWYLFLWDRLRGIRKEITQQELSDVDAVSLVEQCARFHIHCGARLVAEDSSVFDDRLNTENLTKCLQTLKHMYCDLWMNNSITCPNEPEFISYFLLLNLNNGTIMWEMEQLREEVLKSPEIGFVASMYNSLSSNNFVRFFRLVRKASYLNSCLCIRYFHQVRAKALQTYIKALAKIRPVYYPLGSLVEELGFENAEHADAFCSHYGLRVDLSTSDVPCVILSHETFENPTFALPPEREFRLAESKKTGSVGEVVYGGPLPPRSYENHTVHVSFDEHGYLLKSSIQLKDQIPTEIREVENVCSEVTDNRPTQMAAVMPSAKEDGSLTSEKNVPQPSTSSFGGFGNVKNLNTKNVFSSLMSIQPSKGLTAPSNQMFKESSNFLQVPSEKHDSMKFNVDQLSGMQDTMKQAMLQNLQAEQARAKVEAEKKAQAAELEKCINASSEIHMQDLLSSGVKEAATEIALLELKAAAEQQLAEEKQRAAEQLQAQEELRKRILDTTIDKISNESFCDLFNDVVEQMVAQSAEEELSDEIELVTSINILSESYLKSIIYKVTEELCFDVISEEKRRANECARQEAVKRRVRQGFYHWLEKARRSLHRKRVMHDFPASVIPLSIKEHAQRWRISKTDEADAWELCSKGNDKILDIPELKAMPAYPQITFAELIAIQAVHRYDTIRVKLGLHPTDKLLYKLFVSVPEEHKDPAGQVVDWWIKRTLKQNCGMVFEDREKAVYRIVSGVKVTSEVAVYASIQLVRGCNALEKQKSLASGTSAVLFSLSPSSSIEESRSRLTTLLKSINKLPAVPLVVAVVSPLEPPLEGLKQLVAMLELDQWLQHGAISDYQILHVEELFDLKYLSERFNMSFNYMVMTWTPTPEFTLVCLKNVLRSTFQMFFISIQFNYNSSEIYPQHIDDPRVIIGLCNEWLDHMCHEFLSSYHEAKDLCAEEFWPLLHKGAYLPFLNKPKYEQLLQEVIRTVSLPSMEWPPSSEEEFENIITKYCSWLRPDDRNQTARRLSCLNGLKWSEKVKRIPWVNLVEDWMEARINYIETSVIFGTELLCLMRAQNVERLYTYPWWAQSSHIISYLEANGFGRECEMDVDQTVPIEDISAEDANVSTVELKHKSLELNNLKEVTDCVSDLKKVNESLVSRLRTALADDIGSSTEAQINDHLKESETNALPTPVDPLTLLKNIDQQVKDHRDMRSSINNMLSQALAEAVTDTSKESAADPEKNEFRYAQLVSPTSQIAKEKAVFVKEKPNPSKKMDEIMASVNNIVSSLNQKYKILNEDISSTAKITDLKLGMAKVDACSPALSEKLHHSVYVEQSQKRMMGRIHGSSSEETTKSHEKNPLSADDSDLEVMSDDRSISPEVRNISSPSYVDSESDKSASDVEENESGSHSEGSEYEDNIRSKKRLHSNDSDDDSYSGSRIRRHRNESDDDDYSRGRDWDRRVNKRDQDNSSQDVNRHQDSSENENSEGSSQCSELEPTDDEEIQTISSEDSRETVANHANVNLGGASTSLCEDNPSLHNVTQPVLDSYVVEAEAVSENGLAVDDNPGGHLLNLDDPHIHYQSYYVEGSDIGVEDPVFTVSSEMGVLNSITSSDVVVSNSDLISEGNDVVAVSQYEGSSEAGQLKGYDINADRSSEIESSNFVLDHSEDTHQNTSDEEDYYDRQDRLGAVTEESEKNLDEEGSGSEVEEAEEEEYDEAEVEDEGDEEECIEEELAEDEDEAETEPESEAELEEDSDVCEVIDDD